jgi:LPS export ABC transporter protein LptC
MLKFRLNKKSIIIIGLIAVFFAYNSVRKAPEEEAEPKESAVSEFYQGLKGGDETVKINGLSEEQKILSFDMTGYEKDGRKKWDIKGSSADVISDIVILKDIEANSYNEDRTVALKAQNGRYDKKENMVRLENNVVVNSSDGINLKAEWLEWESKTEIIKTDSFVEVEKDNLYAAGYGASASTKHKQVQLDNDVVVKQGEMTISCGGPLAIDYANNEASFYDNVKVTDPRGEILADCLDISFNPDSREIETVTAEGNVELKREENIAKGQRVIYTVASGQAILTGNPEIHIYSKKDLGDAFTGD